MQEIDREGLEIDRKQRGGLVKGAAFFAAVLFLVFIAAGAYADQICSDCHDSTQHGVCDAGNCAACHGDPPVNAGGLIHTYANMPGPIASGSASAGAHAIHATPSGSNYACGACHHNGMSASSGQLVGGVNNGNGLLQIGFNFNGAGGGIYDGVTGLAYPYEGTNGTTVTVGGTKTCSNIYCHSDGTSVATGVVPNSTSPSWNVAGPLACNTCHGFPPLYAQDQPKANSHSWHQHITCNVCHYATTIDGFTITNFTSHANANAVYEVVPDPSALYSGVPVAFSYAYDPGGGRCSNISCHGGSNKNRTWGGVELTAGIGWTPGTECFEVRFTGHLNGTPPQTFSWNFGDGQTGQGENITHFYPGAGSYTVNMTGTDANRHTAATSSQVTAVRANKLPVPDRTVTVSGYTVTVTDYSTDPDYNTCGHTGPGSVMVQWGVAGVPETTVSADLTDTAPGVGRTISRTYTASGTYTLRHAVKDNDPSTYVYSGNIPITVPSTFTVSGSVMRGVCSLNPSVNTTQALCTAAGGTWGPSATPVSGASIRLKKGAQVVKMTTTNASGAYTLTAVLPDSYTVEAVKSGLTFTGTPAAVVTNANLTGINITSAR